MNRLKSSLALAAVVWMLMTTEAALAVRAYTTDVEDLPLRATPSASGKTLLMVPRGSAVALANPRSYTKVRFQKPDGKIEEGWIASRFLSPWPPNSSMARDLGAENEALKTRLDELDQQNTALSQKGQELTDKLTKLNSAYEELKGGSANYLKLKSEYDSASTSLSSAQEQIQTLVQENESLKLARDVRWVVATVAVLLTGWSLGWLTSRRRKRRGTYYW
ncbi:MAG TPA: TIGR04211 family SH3 domain-containing protein [Syntrophobacteraceae bacterium]|nr:TIGR04211 family SH3 domain-containing protein [Syntrophobacteraceae bacterium]